MFFQARKNGTKVENAVQTIVVKKSNDKLRIVGCPDGCAVSIEFEDCLKQYVTSLPAGIPLPNINLQTNRETVRLEEEMKV